MGSREVLTEGTTAPHVLCGTIHFGGSHFRIPCVVKSLSGTRAHLHVFAAKKLPASFSLKMEAIGLETECTVVDRSEKTLIVELDQGVSTLEAGPSLIAPALQNGHSAHDLPANTSPAQPQSQLWIVEDDEDDRAMLSRALEDITPRCSITFFGDGIEFLQHLSEIDLMDSCFAPPLTLLDLNMPRMDGKTTLARVRSDMRFRHLPIIILTTSSNEDDLEATYTLGVTAYITKPNRESDLLKIAKFIESYWAAGVRSPSLHSM